MDRRTAVIAFVLLITLLASCAAPAALPPTAAPQASGTSAPAPKAQPQPTAQRETELVIVQGIEPQRLDMSSLDTVPVSNIGHHINETLMDYDTNFNLKPLLALSWKQLEPTVWQFKFREGVKFSNGEPFNARQVKFTYERVMTHKQYTGRQSQSKYVEKVDLVDEYTLNFHTRGIVPLFPLYQAPFPIVPEGALTQMGDAAFANSPIGTGPYLFKEWVKDDHVTLVKNPNYWGPPPKVDKLTYRTVPDIAARVATFLAGEADIVADLQPASIALVERKPELTVAKVPGTRMIFLYVNLLIESPLRDYRVRQALQYALDKDELVNIAMMGYATMLQGQLVSNRFAGFNPNLKPYPYDPNKSKQLMAEAGFPNGFEVRLVCPRGRYMNDVELCQSIEGQLAKVGVRLKLDIVEWSVHQNEWTTKKGGPIFLSGFQRPPDAALMFDIFAGNTGSNFHGDTKYDALVKAIWEAPDEQSRLQRTYDTSAYMRDFGNWIFLHQQWTLLGVHKRVKNLDIYPNDLIFLKNVEVTGPR